MTTTTLHALRTALDTACSARADMLAIKKLRRVWVDSPRLGAVLAGHTSAIDAPIGRHCNPFGALLWSDDRSSRLSHPAYLWPSASLAARELALDPAEALAFERGYDGDDWADSHQSAFELGREYRERVEQGQRSERNE